MVRLIVDDYARRPQLASRLAFKVRESGHIAAVDPDALGIALQNLVDNALTHGRAGGRVEVAVGPGPTVHVVNDGAIVGAEELATLKRRFKRGARGRGPGTGLGLSIVEQIMRQAGGRLELASPAAGRDDGFEATLVFAARPETPGARGAERPAAVTVEDTVC